MREIVGFEFKYLSEHSVGNDDDSTRKKKKTLIDEQQYRREIEEVVDISEEFDPLGHLSIEGFWS